MGGQKIQLRKSHGGGWFSRELKLYFVFFGLIFSFNFIQTNQVLALFVPTLSASLDQAAASVNGNQVINSANKTTEIPLNLTVNTNNKTGYTATLSSETDETALVNNDSTSGAKINSISSAGLLEDFSNNTWGVKIGNSINFSPIPKFTSPMNAIQTAGKTNGNEVNSIKIGMKLSDSLVSGRYTNKLVFSIFTNNYDHIAIMTDGYDFNAKLKALETWNGKIEHFKKNTVSPVASVSAVNIEDEDSDYEIKLWLDPIDKTAYYYTESEKVYLNNDARYMFYGMRSLTTLNLSNFDTSKVTDMSYMFSYMSNLITLDLSNFDTSQVTNMEVMFEGMSNLTTLNLSNFDTSKVTNMQNMFGLMTNLTILDLSNFDTSKVTDMHGMFYGMPNLTTLNLSNFDTSQVTNMNYMFYGMRNLTTLNLSNFDTSKVTNMSYMFSLRDYDELMDKLEKIYVNNDFDTTKLTNFSDMFRNRKKLRGGNGSYLSDPTTADKSWLRIDDPANGRPGYFTRKP